ncbi:hypothetical protein WMF18_36525 [Sorangium sp. So ce315]|uniref:hypothetical protein n=1 Tax=Sorangium sp. So ce315 TaxID=3133299 RepID=UPI003F604F6C
MVPRDVGDPEAARVDDRRRRPAIGVDVPPAHAPPEPAPSSGIALQDEPAFEATRSVSLIPST